MEALLYFVLWAALIFFVMRLACGAHIMGRSHGSRAIRDKSDQVGEPEFHWVAPIKDRDPVCNKTVETAKAKPSVYAGNVYYFCSRECREVFEAAPDLYAVGGDGPHAQLERRHA